MNEQIQETMKVVCDSILDREQNELYSCSQEELDNYWFFVYDQTKSLTYNLYHFTECLTLYKSKCRRWEEHHNGISCVVERVRDKYIYPKLKEFESHIRSGAANWR